LNFILITGASRGLGYCLAEDYAAAGFSVLAAARNIRGEKLCLLKEKYKDRLILLSMDVSDSKSVEKAAEKAKQLIPHLDIIINNAAVHYPDTVNVLEEVNIENCLDTININAVGPLRVAKEFIGLLDKGTLKMLVNISSEAGSISDCTMGKWFDYNMSKAALNMESKLLHNYLSIRMITVLAIHPGWIKTDMGGPNAPLAPEESSRNIMTTIANNIGRLNSPIFIDYVGRPMNY
jgi:NAD(P)-dependent dehydrogenase (short-subunit alcohol dehydrogenase family)